MQDNFIASRSQRCLNRIFNKNWNYFDNRNCNVFKLVLKNRQIDFVICFTFVVRLSRQFICEINFFCLIFNFEIIFDKQKNLSRLTTIKKRCCYKIL